MKINISGNTKANVINSIADLEQNEKVLFAEPNSILELEQPGLQTQSNNGMARGGLALNNDNRYRKYTNDPYLVEQEGIYLHNVDKVWNAFTKGSSDVVVGVIDTGIYNHPDLSANLSLGYFCGTGVNETNYVDYDGHGTSVASVIGARGNNNRDISGVCQRVSLYSLRITDQTSPSTALDDAIARAILKADVNNIPIVNLSFGGGSYDATIQMTMNMYDGLIICSAGNDGREITSSNPYYSPSYDADNVIAVGNMTTSKTVVDDSNYSDIYVDIFALGSDVWVCNKNGSTEYFNNGGTSHAAPFVAGVAALLLSYDNTLTAAQLKQYILDGANTVSSLEEYCVTGGYLDAYGAFLAMLNDTTNSIKLAVLPQWQKDGNITYFGSRYVMQFTYEKSYAKLTEVSLSQALYNVLYDENTTISGELTISSYDDNTGKTHVTVNLQLMQDIAQSGVPLLEFHFITYGNVSTTMSKIIVGMKRVYAINDVEIPANGHRILLAGDANEDGTVTTADAELILSYGVNNTTFTGNQLLSADVTGDNVINATDSLRILSYCNGNILSFY